MSSTGWPPTASITPYDDSGKPNQYPMMRLQAKTGGVTVAAADVVLPVSDEMDCKLCHLSVRAATPNPPAAGSACPNPVATTGSTSCGCGQAAGRQSLYAEALAAQGFPAEGLETSVVRDDKPVLCAACRLSEALPNAGYGENSPLTRAMHSRHAGVIDPRNNLALDASANRVSCCCAPSRLVHALPARGDGPAVAGRLARHAVPELPRVDGRRGFRHAHRLAGRPNCQACHSDAVANGGKIRFTVSSLTRPATCGCRPTRVSRPTPTRRRRGVAVPVLEGPWRIAVLGLPRVDACDFPEFSSERQRARHLGAGPRRHDLRVHLLPRHADARLRRRAAACTSPTTWAQEPRRNGAVGGVASCRACHGLTERGTELSRVFKDCTITASSGTRNYKQGQQVGCYDCHDGSNKGDPSTRGFATATGGAFLDAFRAASDLRPHGQQHGRAYRTQPSNGTLALTGKTATYYPETGFHGTDSFTFVGGNGYTESPPATVNLTVTEKDSVAGGCRTPGGGRCGSVAAAPLPRTPPGRGGPRPGRPEQFRGIRFGTDPLDGRSHPAHAAALRDAAGVQVPFVSELGVKSMSSRARDATPGAPGPSCPPTSGAGSTAPPTLPDSTGGLLPGRHYRARVQTN
ncbi:MAG: hypothetical protein U1F87_09705 [Kiritimatiellia bacterium]